MSDERITAIEYFLLETKILSLKIFTFMLVALLLMFLTIQKEKSILKGVGGSFKSVLALVGSLKFGTMEIQARE